MTTINSERQARIKTVVMQQPDAIVEQSIRLWEALASELISIIGEGGFQSLYYRSLHLCAPTHPWLEPDYPRQTAESIFSWLQSGLGTLSQADATKASIDLLITFIDTLALLIGDQLTDSIMRTAWADVSQDKQQKEFRK